MKIIQMRKAKNITQAELAERCETTQQQIARIENGAVDPRLSTLRRIADALDCELSELFFTREEFLAKVRAVAVAHSRKPANLSVLELNTLCAKEQYIPTFHPLWERVVIKGGKIILVEGTRHE